LGIIYTKKREFPKLSQFFWSHHSEKIRQIKKKEKEKEFGMIFLFIFVANFLEIIYTKKKEDLQKHPKSFWSS
jgi:F0F1-type ATP synthase membrane subunit a